MLRRLGKGLDESAIPAKSGGKNLLIATWNIRAFGDLTEKWTSASTDSPKRNLADVCAIAKIIERFDVVAIQETRDNLKGLRYLIGRLGQGWSFVVTDVGEGEPANGERLAYVFDNRRVRLTGLAGELVVPKEWFGRIDKGALAEQFVRTPYAVSFAAGDQAFTLVTLHVVFGKKASDRLAELRAIAAWLADRADDDDEFNRNLIALGDFNIDHQGDPNWQAFTDQGLSPPYELYGLTRTIFDKPKAESFYDQIAWFTKGNREALTLGYSGKAGRFEWTKYILQSLENISKSWRISDHYPLWCEFSL
jgi:Endonuclease/Exonuclease/phosphatase family